MRAHDRCPLSDSRTVRTAPWGRSMAKVMSVIVVCAGLVSRASCSAATRICDRRASVDRRGCRARPEFPVSGERQRHHALRCVG